MQFKEILALCSENCIKPINTPSGQHWYKSHWCWSNLWVEIFKVSRNHRKAMLYGNVEKHKNIPSKVDENPHSLCALWIWHLGYAQLKNWDKSCLYRHVSLTPSPRFSVSWLMFCIIISLPSPPLRSFVFILAYQTTETTYHFPHSMDEFLKCHKTSNKLNWIKSWTVRCNPPLMPMPTESLI